MKLLHGEGGHYSLVKIESYEEIDGLEADELNWIFTGTSGVHGTYRTAEDYLDPKQYTWIGEKTVRDTEGEEYQPSITVLVVHPRLVCTRFGHIHITKKNVEWLRKQEIKTSKAIRSKWGDDSTPPATAEKQMTSTVVDEPKGERIYMTDTFRKEYKELDAAQRENMSEVKYHAEVLLGYMDRAVPPEERSERSRCMAIARTNLETAVMWAVKGVTTAQE